MKNKRAQQEMVGFVLIVVLVVVGLMVFLLISLRGGSEESSSIEVENLLTAIMKQTTECAITFEPEYDSYRDLFRHCHQDRRCSNLDKKACEYLNEGLGVFINEILESEASVGGYQLDFFVKEGEGQQGLLRIINGDCNGKELSFAEKKVISNSDTLVIRMKICRG